MEAATATSKLVTGLTNGTTYDFRIRAVNGVGDGDTSETSVTPANRPGAPPNFQTRREISTRIRISWDAAADNGSEITRYAYRRRAGTGSWIGWFTVPGGGAARSRTISGLDAESDFTWQLRAQNDVGWGQASTATTPSFDPPGGPTGAGEPDNIGDDGEPDIPPEEIEEDVREVEGEQVASGKPLAVGEEKIELQVQVAPNPFNDSISLSFLIPQDGQMSLTVYNLRGQIVKVVEEGRLPTGWHVRYWHGQTQSGRPVSSGTYLYRLVLEGNTKVGKVAFIQ